MADELKPIRRVVTGNDDQGRSCVLFDSAAPNVNPGAISRGTCMTDIWVYKTAPAIISGGRDDGNLPFHFEPPHEGGHLRIVQSTGKPAITTNPRTQLISLLVRRDCAPTASGIAVDRIYSARRCTNRPPSHRRTARARSKFSQPLRRNLRTLVGRGRLALAANSGLELLDDLLRAV